MLRAGVYATGRADTMSGWHSVGVIVINNTQKPSEMCSRLLRNVLLNNAFEFIVI